MQPYFAPSAYPYWYDYPGYVEERYIVPEPDRTERCQRLVADRDRTALREAPAAVVAALRAARSGQMPKPRCGQQCDVVLEQRAGRWVFVYYGCGSPANATSFQGVPIVFDPGSAPLSGALGGNVRTVMGAAMLGFFGMVALGGYIGMRVGSPRHPVAGTLLGIGAATIPALVASTMLGGAFIDTSEG